MSQTLLLDLANWDLMVDAYGNIAVASAPYALAQDAASAIKTFQGELWYDTTQGIPYWSDVFGEPINLPMLKAQMQNAALSVPGVATATVYITAFTGRQISGQVQITDAAGTMTAAGF